MKAWWSPAGRARTGLAILAILAGVAAGAQWISPQDPFATSRNALAPPGGDHPFGTDDLGRDVFAGVVHGTSVSLAVGFAAAALSALVGIAIGGAAGAARGADLVLMRVTEFAQSLPRFFLVITLVSLFGGQLWFIVAALGLTAWPSTARMFRAQVLALMNRDFVAASYAAGEGSIGVLRRHILPLALPVLASQIAFQAGSAILAEAGLSFLGLGDPSVMSWGGQLGSAQRFVREAWWMSVFPGLGITVTVFACNLLADAVGAPEPT
ncbi:MAG: ABC transporter permease [Vicinamibacterales bacterium]